MSDWFGVGIDVLALEGQSNKPLSRRKVVLESQGEIVMRTTSASKTRLIFPSLPTITT